jgi:hypothetical protein
MKLGDIVQVRRFDGADHWLFASVQDPATNRVAVNHPGHPEDGKVIVAAGADLRTRADVLNLITVAQSLVTSAGSGGLTDAQLRTLATQDGWWNQFLPRSDGKLTEHAIRAISTQRTSLHTFMVRHYTNIAARLS